LRTPIGGSELFGLSLSTGRFVAVLVKKEQKLYCRGAVFDSRRCRGATVVSLGFRSLIMADINETVSNILEKLSKILEKPYNALALGAGLTFLLLLLYHVTNLGGGYFGAFFTFLHIVSGITWIGLLYYFNLVQIPTMPKIPPEMKPAIGQYIAPEALFWFRWSAVATVVTGLIVFSTSSAVHNLTIITGGILGLVMAFNVWFVVWPNQKKALGLVPADASAKAQAARLAMLTSRANFVLSLPMLYCMVTARLVG
jgi:hypothetical protein